MKREILFKAKRIDNNKWVFGGYHQHQNTSLCMASKEDHENNIKHLIIVDGMADWNMPIPIRGNEVKPETVCQLFNCGSDDFYEDDKVIYNGKEYIVKFNLSFAELERNMVEHGVNETIVINEDVAYLMKVIGNVHD